MSQNAQRAGRVGAQITTRRDLGGNSFGNRGAQLADSIMGFANAAARTAEVEGERAYKEGLRARLDDVQRENANDANKGLFAPLFRQRALDGFDFQDAQFDAANLALEEQLQMHEALKNSTRLEDFQAWALSRDEAFRAGIEGKSDIYRTALAEQMKGHRESQARTFGSWVIQNRERMAREAAAAAAKSKALAAAAAANAASQGAFGQLFEGVDDINTAMQKFVDSAPGQFGVDSKVAQDAFAEALLQYAQVNNDHTVLDGLDPRFLTPEQRSKWGAARNQIQGWNRAEVEFELWQRNTIEDEHRRALTQERNSVLAEVMPQVITGEVSPSKLGEVLFDLQYYRDRPEELLSTLNNLTGVAQATVDPSIERATLNDAQEDIIAATLRGEDPMDVVLGSLANIRSAPARQALMDAAQGAQRLVEDRVWSDDVLAARQRDFQTLFANTAEEGTMASQLGFGAPTPAWVGYVTDAMQDYKGEMIDTWADWYKSNPNSRMDRATKRALERQVFDEVRSRYEAIAASTTELQLRGGVESNVDALNDLLR